MLEERIKYPPFESYRFKPELLPIAIKKTEIKPNVTKSEAYQTIRNLPPPFRIGSKASWLVERRYTLDDETLKLDKEHAQEMLEAVPEDSIVDKQRNGWYLTPNVIHKQARKIMNFSVSILLIALTYLFLEPVISYFGVPSVGTGRVRFGLLDYPLLAVIVVPILFIPIFMRVGANFSDLVKQRRFLRSQPKAPNIKFHSDTTSGGDLIATINFPETKENWQGMSVLWRVGVLPPSRKALMETLGRKENTQPAPGLTTELPHHWSVDLDDGTGGGLHTNYYDDFGTWTHYWGTWTGTGKFTGNEVTQFIHLNYGWNDEGKIIYHNIHIDGKDFWAEVNAAEAASGSE